MGDRTMLPRYSSYTLNAMVKDILLSVVSPPLSFSQVSLIQLEPFRLHFLDFRSQKIRPIGRDLDMFEECLW